MSDKKGELEHSALYPSAPPSAPPTYDQTMGTSKNTGFAENLIQGQAPYNPAYPPAGNQMYPPLPPPNVKPDPVIVQQPHTVVIQHNPSIAVGPRSMRMQCPNCHAQIKTETTADYLCAAHFCCLALFIFGMCLCSCIPYCMDSCRSVTHKCPNCKTDLGTYVPG